MIRLLFALALAQPPPPTQPPVRVVAVDGGYTLTVSCANCSGGGGGSSSSGLVYVADAGVLNVNPVTIASMPTVNIADAGTLNVNFPATQAVTQSTSPWVVNGTVTVLQGPGQDGGVWQIAVTGPLFIGDAGVLNVNFPASQAVTGTFWQAVQNVNIVDAGPPLNVNPVAIASLPLVFIQDAGTLNINLPPGAATAARQDTGNTSLANLDVALSTRTKPADQQHTIIDSSVTVPVSLATAPTTPITAATLPLPAGAATDATLSGLLDGGVGLLSTIAANQTSGNEQVQVLLNRYPLNPFLPRCNPVRRTGCQP